MQASRRVESMELVFLKFSKRAIQSNEQIDDILQSLNNDSLFNAVEMSLFLSFLPILIKNYFTI